MFPVTLILALVVAAVTAVGIAFRQRWLALSAPSVLLGGLSYFYASMYAARLKGAGHFFSFPVGGYAIRDSGILLSVIFWTGLWAAVLHFVIPRWGREGAEGAPEGVSGPGVASRRVPWGKVMARGALAVFPLALTPLFGWLISEGCLGFGGGCKDIVLVFPWMAWSLVYFIVFVVFTARKSPPGRSVALSAAIATGILALLLAALYLFSLAGIG